MRALLIFPTPTQSLLRLPSFALESTPLKLRIAHLPNSEKAYVSNSGYLTSQTQESLPIKLRKSTPLKLRIAHHPVGSRKNTCIILWQRKQLFELSSTSSSI